MREKLLLYILSLSKPAFWYLSESYFGSISEHKNTSLGLPRVWEHRGAHCGEGWVASPLG